MDLRKQLAKFGSVPFTHGAVVPLLGDYLSPNDKVAALAADGTLLRLKKGFYVLGPDYRSAPVSLPLVANLLYGPSCVSLEYALAWHGLIPEAVYQLTSVTSRRSKHFDTALGRFSYLHVPEVVFGIGMRSEQNSDGTHFLIAGPEKALCDKVLLTRGLHKASLQRMRDFLFDDLRLEPDTLREFDQDILRQYLASPVKAALLATLCRVVEECK